jgi:hypothetical protein
MPISTMLKGASGDFEVNRVVGALGATFYILCANGFEAYEVVLRHAVFDLTAYCIAFPTGLGVAIASIAGAVSLKDRNVAKAAQTQAVTAGIAPAPVAGEGQ